jgi:site-specific DNA-methyltransferase (adenine-specific)
MTSPALFPHPLENQLLFGESLEQMARIADQSVDLILADLPYEVSRNAWDTIIPTEPMWEQYERIIRPNGAILLTATQPFSSVLVMSNPKMFKYEWIWQKTIGSGQLNAHKQPLRNHESILVFYKKPPVYNPQMTEGKPYHAKRKATFEGPGYNAQRPSETKNEGTRLPKSVLTFSNPRIKGGHPTQKPLEMFRYLIRTYSNPNDLVLDNAIGSGTTAVAALLEGRRFIGIDNSQKYFDMASARIEQTKVEIKAAEEEAVKASAVMDASEDADIRAAVSERWAEDWNSPEDSAYDE